MLMRTTLYPASRDTSFRRPSRCANVSAWRNRRHSRAFGGYRVDKNEGEVPGHNPSFAELIAALKALQQPQEPKGLEKHVTTIIVGATLAIGVWVVSSLNTMQQTVARMDTTMTSVQSTTQDMSRRIDLVAGAQADMKAQQATMEQRLTTLERYHNRNAN